MILPFVGFIAQCILVRYKAQYDECLISTYDLKSSELVEQREDQVQIYLRVCIAMTFFYSIS